MELKEYDKIILGIDPGTNIMGYGVLGIHQKTPIMITMGILTLEKMIDPYMKLLKIYNRVQSLVEQYLPDEMSIEAPFYGKNVQSMLKLGRAQGVAIAAALSRDVPIYEYEPRKIKLAITGNGGASKEQVKQILIRILDIHQEDLLPQLDASDALAVALCHYYESNRPIKIKTSKNWKEFISQHPEMIYRIK